MKQMRIKNANNLTLLFQFLEFFYTLQFFLQPLIQIFVPIYMRAPLLALQALRIMPLLFAFRATASGIKGIPYMITGTTPHGGL